MKIFFVRHGETSKNVSGVLHEKGDIELLNETGEWQISETAKELLDHPIKLVVCSEELRAKKSASIIAEMLECPIEYMNGFTERNWGIYSNRPWSEVKEVLDPLTLEERYNYIPPEGESWSQFEKRLVKSLNESISIANGEDIVIVTHGGVIRALIPYLLSVPKEESFKYDPANASITEFEYENDRFSCIRIDDTSHLTNQP